MGTALRLLYALGVQRSMVYAKEREGSAEEDARE